MCIIPFSDIFSLIFILKYRFFNKRTKNLGSPIGLSHLNYNLYLFSKQLHCHTEYAFFSLNNSDGACYHNLHGEVALSQS